MSDNIGRNSKESVRLWGDSWFNLLLAIHKSETAINTHQTRFKCVFCEKTKANPEGRTFIPVLHQSNFWKIVAEIEKQTHLGPALKEALKEIREVKELEPGQPVEIVAESSKRKNS